MSSEPECQGQGGEFFFFKKLLLWLLTRVAMTATAMAQRTDNIVKQFHLSSLKQSCNEPQQVYSCASTETH